MNPNLNLQPTPQVLVTQSPVQPPASSNKKKAIYIFTAFLAILLILASSLSYLFIYVPQVQAKEYLEETGKDFNAVQNKLKIYQGDLDPLSKSLAKSKTAFYEVTENRSYLEAVEDTKQDIKDINETLQLIKEAKQTKELLKVPDDLKELDEFLNEYYISAEAGLQLLMEFENFQTELLNAWGAELNEESLRINEVVKPGAQRQEIVDYFNKISKLATQTIDDIKKVTLPLDENLKIYYELKLGNTEDIATSAAAIVEDLYVGTAESDKMAFLKMVQLSDRTIVKENRRRQSAQDFVEDSPIRKLFEESAVFEGKITEEFTRLKTEYGIKDNFEIPTKESSPSAILEASSSASPSGALNPNSL